MTTSEDSIIAVGERITINELLEHSKVGMLLFLHRHMCLQENPTHFKQSRLGKGLQVLRELAIEWVDIDSKQPAVPHRTGSITKHMMNLVSTGPSHNLTMQYTHVEQTLCTPQLRVKMISSTQVTSQQTMA